MDQKTSEAASSLMLRETAEAPAAVARIVAENDPLCRELAERLRTNPPRFAVTCARGSSDSAATYAKYLLEIRLGLVVASVGPSVSSIYDARPAMGDALFLAVSQSGRSPDLLALAESARKDGALTVALVNDDASPLAELCEVVLPLRAGAERSVAATKSYIAALASILQLVGHWSGDSAIVGAVKQLPGALATALTKDWRKVAESLRQTRSLYVAGRGPGYAVAQEAALKFKETCGLHAEAISAAEIMHGPMALAGPDFPVLLLSQQDAALSSLSALADALVARGVPVIAAGPAAGAGMTMLPSLTGLHPFSAPIALIQSFYPLAEALARMRGLDPDHPPSLSKVTETR